MKNSVNFKFGNIELTVGSYKGVPTYKWDSWRYKHKITIVYNGKKANFTFYNSQNAYDNGQIYLTDGNMKDALDCIINDATTAYNCGSWHELAAEFGIEDYNEARRVYYACNRTYFKLTYVLDLSSDDLFDIENYLRDYDEEEEEI